MSKICNPILRYYGGKWRLAPWIISHFPRHRVYVEPFCGAASVLLRKPRSKVEVLNDRHERLVSLFQVLRDPDTARQLRESLKYTPCSMVEYMEARERCADPLEDARRMIILGQQAHGSTGAAGGKKSGWRRGVRRFSPSSADCWARLWKQVDRWSARLRAVYLESSEALEVIRRYDSKDTLFYIDPPYLMATRNSAHGYAHELPDQGHKELAEALQDIKGMAIVSGYPSALYRDELYKGWHVESREARTDKGGRALECLWMNFDPDIADTPRYRQQAGARKTHQARTTQTTKAIEAAISKLEAGGHRVTRKAVAEMVSISREHISRRYGHLFEK